MALPNRTVPPFVRSVDASFPHTRLPDDARLESRWVAYMKASGAPRRPQRTQEERETAEAIFRAYDARRERALDEEALLEKTAKVKTPREKRRALLWRTRRRLMRSPFAPLFFRIFILGTTIISLSLAVDIERYDRPCRDDSTHILAIIVNSIAIPYTLYISWDEFFSPPIGLRKSRSKLRLLILDIFFIIFYSADLALAFESVTHDDSPNGSCVQQGALIFVLLVSLMAWVSTLLLSLFRLLDKMDV